MHGKTGLQPRLDGMNSRRPVVTKIVFPRRKKCDCQETQSPDWIKDGVEEAVIPKRSVLNPGRACPELVERDLP
jgi:hypothetical protein